jgi:DNA adenine methylase
MKYMGSKARIAKHILPVILKNRKEGQCYVEPFVGGANMIDKVDGWRIGADVNPYLIKALLLIRDNPELIPRNNSEYTKEMYLSARNSDLSNPVDCFAMFNYSFGATFKGSWAKNSRGSDYVKECVRNVLMQSSRLAGCKLLNISYDKLGVPNESIIYCDPPYASTFKYKGTDNFNHSIFWQWCREKCKEGHQVFISEYNAPDDFVCVWQKEVNSNANAKATSRVIEKLFVHKSQA